MVKLNFSDNQLSKLRNQHPVQVSPQMVGSGQDIDLSDQNMKKLKSAYDKGKSVRLILDDDEIEGSGLKQIRKGLRQVTHVGNKINKALHNDKLQRKVLNTSRKIKNTINKGSVIGDLDIPGVSTAYDIVHEIANDGDKYLHKGAKAKTKLVHDFDEVNEKYNPKSGSGANNPYLADLPKRTTTKKNGGSFRTLGGSVNKKAILQTDSAINIKPSNPSFNPLPPKTFEELQRGGSYQKCQHCGH
jgi:hypothetical protein